MNGKNIHLTLAILASLVFIGYLSESEHYMFGYSINMWIVRIIWLIIAVNSFIQYFKIKKKEKNAV